MTLQHVFGATVVVLAASVVTVTPASAQRRDGSLLPQEESGQVTAVGCLVKGGTVRGGDKNRYALARVRKGPVASVPEATCTADAGADALDLDNESGQAGVTDAMTGRWVEITGRLERETSKDPDDLRELDVKTVRLVPVVPPKPPAPPPAPRQRPKLDRPHGRSRWHLHRLRHHHRHRHPGRCRRRRAPFRQLDWPGCSRWQWASLCVRSVSGSEIDAAHTDSDRGHDSSRCCALRPRSLTVFVRSWRASILNVHPRRPGSRRASVEAVPRVIGFLRRQRHANGEQVQNFLTSPHP